MNNPNENPDAPKPEDAKNDAPAPAEKPADESQGGESQPSGEAASDAA